MVSPKLIESTIAQSLDAVRPFMSDPDVTEIMVNSDGSVWVEARGEITDTHALLAEHDREIALRAVAAMVNQDLTEGTDQSVVSMSIGGLRFAGALKGVDPIGTVLSVRKHPEPGRRKTLEQLVAGGMLTQQQADTLIDLIINKEMNAIFIGKTSSGKTTLLNAVLGKLPAHVRIGLIEDAKELEIPVPNKNCFLTNPEKGLTARVLVQLAMRMRYDRLVIGESRGTETYDLVRAFSSGHNGSISTIHGSSAKRGLQALEMLYQMSIPQGGGVSIEAARSYIAEAIHLLVYAERRYEPNGEGGFRSIRQVKEIVLVKGVKDGEYEIEPI
ncbi:MAG: CpaF family protein [Burkholderiaceae bacterium]|nr:MAG: CpaF family protein [Burkholderiaceae bacterium]